MDIRIDRESTVPVYVQIRGGIRDLILSGRLPDGFRLPPGAPARDGARGQPHHGPLRLQGAEGRRPRRGARRARHRGRLAEGRKSDVEPAGPLPWRQLARDGSVRRARPARPRRPRPHRAARRHQPRRPASPPPSSFRLEDLRRVQEEILVRKGPEALLPQPDGRRHGVSRGALPAHGPPRHPLEPRRRSSSRRARSRGSTSSPGRSSLRGTSSSSRSRRTSAPSRCSAPHASGSSASRPTTRGCGPTSSRRSSRASSRASSTRCPTFQNPSGCVLSLPRRRHLLELAWRHQVPILEDDPYSDLRYEGEALPSLKALDPYGHVIHLSSFSKVLFPGLRLGWIAAPRPLVRQLALVKQTVDLHSGTLGQWIVEGFLSGGLFAKHLRGDARGLPAAPRRPPGGPRGGSARRLHVEPARGRLLRLVPPPRRRPSRPAPRAGRRRAGRLSSRAAPRSSRSRR